MVHAHDENQFQIAEQILQQNISYSEQQPEQETQIYRHIRAD